MSPRWLVVFRSHPTPPFDTTVVETRADNQLEALRNAKRDEQISHPWHLAYAIPWPRGCANVNAAAKKIAASR